jgi:hypothetical protein
VATGPLPTATSIPAAWTSTTVSDPTDESTRYLASAVHLDHSLADEIVEETLAEPRRAIPPSPGVRNEPVLREAAAARARRRIVGGLALLFTVPVVVLSLVPFLVWLAHAVAWRVGTALGAVLDRRFAGTRPVRNAVIGVTWLVLLVALTLPVVLAAEPGLVPGAASGGDPGNPDSAGHPALPDPNMSIFFAALLLLLVTFFLEEIFTWRHVTRRFRHGGYPAGTNVTDFVRWASGPYEDRLQQVAQLDAQRGTDSVVVYRGYDPFVGSGRLDRRWSIAVEMVPGTGPEAGDGAVPTFRPQELHDFVTGEVKKLRRARTLTPGHRLAGMEMTHQIVVSAEALLHYRDASPLVEQLITGQNVVIPGHVRDQLIDSSPEWMRYYRCYRVETWERLMVVSAFLRASCEEGVLYLAWNGLVLPPIADRYRQVDREPRWPLATARALWRAAGAVLLLPATLAGRVRELARTLYRDVSPPATRLPTPAQSAETFGAASSVRERAAGDYPQSHLHAADAEQHLKIMERRVLDAVHRFLSEKGISTTEFDAHAMQVINSWVAKDAAGPATHATGRGTPAAAVAEPARAGAGR